MKGSNNNISLKGDKNLVKISFNPTNKKIVSISFKNKLEIYELKDCLEMNGKDVESGIIAIPQRSLEFNNLE